MTDHFMPASRRGRIALLSIVAIWLLAGMAIGRAHAWNQSVGGMTAAFGGIVFVLAAVAVLVFGIAAALVERVIRASRGAAARATRAGVAGLLLGIGAGYATAAATGGIYVIPVIRESVGTTNADLTSPTATFTPRADGGATCYTVPDGDALGSITALELGELEAATLRAIVTIESEASVRLELFLDGADVPGEDGIPPSWTGSGRIARRTPDGLAATVVFDELRVVGDPTDPKLPPPPEPWTGSLSGSLDWSCAPFG